MSFESHDVRSGTEKIIVSLVDSNGAVISKEELPIDVKMAILGPLGDGAGWWRLTGQTTTHPDNHYGATYTVETVGIIAMEYFRRTGTTLGINDMSLEWGGLLDIDGNWTTPHITHRKGTSADIDRHVYNPRTGENVLMNCESDRRFREIVNRYYSRLVCESGGRKHIDFY